MRQMFEADATRAVITDWVELELHLSDRPFYTDAHLIRAEAVVREPDQADEDPEADDEDEPEILQPAEEKRRSEVWEELLLRQQTLGESYPFLVVGTATGGWKLSPRADVDDEAVMFARWMYLTALTMACFRNSLIAKQKADKPGHKSLATQIGKYFQHIAALAAVNMLGAPGEVYSFGWPRKNRSKFRLALVDLAQTFGSGKVRRHPPANSKGHEKDGTVDLVVWRAYAGPSAGDPLYYGQVASGKNWRDKPIQAYLRGKFLLWFKEPLTMAYLGATFMPFVKHTDVYEPSSDRFSMQEAIQDEDRELAANYGTMIDRLALTMLFAQGHGKAERMHGCEDPKQVLLQSQAWIAGCRKYCDQVA